MSWLSSKKNVTLCLAMTARPILQPKYWIHGQLLIVTRNQTLFSFRFLSNILAGKAHSRKRECTGAAKIGPDLRLVA